MDQRIMMERLILTVNGKDLAMFCESSKILNLIARCVDLTGKRVSDVIDTAGGRPVRIDLTRQHRSLSQRTQNIVNEAFTEVKDSTTILDLVPYILAVDDEGSLRCLDPYILSLTDMIIKRRLADGHN